MRHKISRHWILIIFFIRHLQSNKVGKEEIFKYIFENYASTDLPVDSNQTRVMVYMKLLAINSVNVSNMDYSTDLYLRQEWVDPRLRWDDSKEHRHFNSNIVTPSLKEKVWLPDLFFRNGKAGYVHQMTGSNYLMRLNPRGEILYSQKITMGFSCQMELHTFPLDTQHCEMDIGSYGYTVDELKFYWRRKDPMIIGNTVKVPEFNAPTKVQTEDCTSVSKTTTGLYTCLKVIFTLKRQLGSYLVSTFIPNSLIVIVSWLNFWIRIDAAPARVSLGLLTLLGILTQASGITQTLPRVSYIKAIDVWMIACIVFVIGAFIEYILASTAMKNRKSKQWNQDVIRVVHQEIERLDRSLLKSNASTHSVTSFANDFNTMVSDTLNLKYYDKIKMIRQNRPFSPELTDSDIDRYSRFIFPSCFILYNLFFWYYYVVIVNYPNG